MGQGGEGFRREGRLKPPFRADQVGSLLRPPQLKLDPKKAIREVAAKQESIGLQGITDGEFSRQWWHLDFLAHLEGVTLRENPGPKFGGTEEQPPIPTVTGKLRYSKPICMRSPSGKSSSITVRMAMLRFFSQ